MAGIIKKGAQIKRAPPTTSLFLQPSSGHTSLLLPWLWPGDVPPSLSAQASSFTWCAGPMLATGSLTTCHSSQILSGCGSKYLHVFANINQNTVVVIVDVHLKASVSITVLN